MIRLNGKQIYALAGLFSDNNYVDVTLGEEGEIDEPGFTIDSEGWISFPNINSEIRRKGTILSSQEGS